MNKIAGDKNKMEMLGRIKHVREVTGQEDGMDGYEVATDKYVYQVLIENKQDCYESWGYIASEDNFSQYIGAKLLEVVFTDTGLAQTILNAPEYLDEGGIQFVDFVTDKGTFQLAVYNAHNGYYGHDIKVIAKEVLLGERL